MTNLKQDVLFAGLPRRRRLAGIVTIGLWLGLAIAFISDAVPTRSPADWLYGVEARRDAHAHARAAHAATEAAASPARVAARAVPGSERESRPSARVNAAALSSHTPAFACSLP